MDLSNIPLIDNHCHPLHHRQPNTEAQFRKYFSESRDSRIHSKHLNTSLHYRTNLMLVAELLDLPVDSTGKRTIEVRNDTGLKNLTRLAIKKSNTIGLIMDEGFPPEIAMSQDDTIAILRGTGCTVRKVRRLEMLYEAAIESSDTFNDAESKIIDSLTDMRKKGIYGLKSVIAYRTGLNIQPAKKWEALDGFSQLKIEQDASKDGTIRVAHKAVEDYLTRLAMAMAGEQNIPVQFHTALGDTDEDMLESNPLRLRDVLEDPAFTKTPIVPLHVFPYVQETAYLAHVYGNVFFDLSYAIPLTHGAASTLIEDALSIAPYSKLMYGTDAPGLPDLWYSGGVVWRRALSKVLSGWIAEGAITKKLANDVAQRVLYKNAAEMFSIGA